MRGKSSPENPVAFYQHLFQSLDQYNSSEYGSMTTNMAFEYFNTSSSKCIYMFLKKLDDMCHGGKKIIVNWFYEEGDEDMKEAGEDISSFFGFEFNFKEVPEIKVLGEQKNSDKQLIAA